MKKIIALTLIMTLLISTVTATFAGVEMPNQEKMVLMEDGTYLTMDELVQYLYDHDAEIKRINDNQSIIATQDALYKPTNNNYSIYARSAGFAGLVEGAWNIPGLGWIIITSAAITLQNGLTIKAGSREFRKIQSYFAKKKTKEQIAEDIPSRLKSGDTQVDLDKFDQKVKGKVKYKNKKTGWTIESTDGNTHGGGVQWKLRDSDGERVATLDGEGNILRK